MPVDNRHLGMHEPAKHGQRINYAVGRQLINIAM